MNSRLEGWHGAELQVSLSGAPYDTGLQGANIYPLRQWKRYKSRKMSPGLLKMQLPGQLEGSYSGGPCLSLKLAVSILTVFIIYE